MRKTVRTETDRSTDMKCLIVEDDPYTSYILSENFQTLQYDATFARSLAEATKLLRTTKFDVIVLDQFLPDGPSSILSILAASTQPNCRVILLAVPTAYPKGEYTTLCPGVDWILRTPVALPELNALLDYAARDRTHHPTAAYATF